MDVSLTLTTNIFVDSFALTKAGAVCNYTFPSFVLINDARA